ncbi:MAG: hypothetical protein K2Q03_01705 [Sphingobacteriaceae bacterium]|nr:hypothetical protein [Sphingobacteriaceae bacterium]
MKKKFLLNVFYSLGFILSMFGFVWSYKAENYPMLGLFVVAAVFFGFVKVQLLKEVSKSIKK